MGRPRKTNASSIEWIHSTRLHAVLYSFLLVFTPFILLQNYLVDIVASISTSRMSLGGWNLPIVPVVAAVALLAIVIWQRKRITRRVLLAAAIILLMNALSQQMSDYYFGQNFYDLLQNWHYLAYALFGPMVYRDLDPRGVRFSRILWIIFFCALGLSTFDESFQRYMSSRVFDLSDTAKDVWGCLMGLVAIALCSRHARELRLDLKSLVRMPRLQTLDHPLVALVLMACFTLIFLSCASLMSDAQYAPLVALFSIGLSALALGLYLLLLRKPGRIAIGALALIAVCALGYSALHYRGQEIVSHRNGLTVYRGMPLLFFDALIFPDGHFRLVDRKHSFTSRDQKRLLRQKSDIIVVGTGRKGLGGQGFPEPSMVQFLHNPYSGGVTQVIIQRTADACLTFNRLKKEGKRVAFVIHNTC
ncbi:MAG: VanZ family protein [Candidatus Eisenbacteria bacterium]|nr:VanZ family protein [Candidatus Eisenbacteria bacterium]